MSEASSRNGLRRPCRALSSDGKQTGQIFAGEGIHPRAHPRDPLLALTDLFSQNGLDFGLKKINIICYSTFAVGTFFG